MRSSLLILFLGGHLGAFSAGQNPELKIVPVEGQGAINIVNQGGERNLIVRVEEKYGAPGKGIPVTFTLPSFGPSGRFKNGELSITVTTDEGGYATVRGFRSNQVAGQYNIRVSAAAPGGVITLLIPQTNAGDTVDDRRPSRKRLIWTVVAAAAAGSGAIMALAGK